MLKNLIKVAFRNIFKDFGYSSLNILGLTIGITSTLFLVIYISDELSYDKYHENADRIYRVTSNIAEPDDAFDWIVAQFPFAQYVKENYPEVIDAVRIINDGRTLYKNGEIEFYENDIYYADSTVFEMLSYGLLEGDPKTVLNEPNTIVLTETLAKKYFGTANPVGKNLDVPEAQTTYRVTGVMKDVPKNSHFRFDGLISRTTLPADFSNSWGNFGVFTYLLLQEGVSPETMEEKFLELYDIHMAQIFERMGITIKYSLLNITDIHLKSTSDGEPEPTGSYMYVYIFAIVALFLILVASMNYMNLATSRSIKRAKEVGLRKVVGSNRGRLIIQFLTESTALTIISLLLSIVIVISLINSFNDLAGKSYELDVVFTPPVLLSILSIIILIGILGGSYPAFFLSRFNPIYVMKGDVQSKTRGISFRKILVILQFAISSFMIISTWLVYNQLDYLKNKDLGYDQENVVRLQLTSGEMIRKSQTLKQALLESPDIVKVACSNTNIGEGSGKVIFSMETDDGMVQKGVNFGVCDHDLIETLNITMLKGRDFQYDILGDTLDGVLVNETLAKRMNWDNPIGKKVVLGDGQNVNAKVIGLMKDFHQTGVYSEVESFMLVYRLENRIIYAKLSGNNTQSALRFIEEKWNELFPEQPFNYEFLEDRFKGQFESDEKRGFIFILFTILTIVISCLGLFGLASYTVEQRTKEVGIRKVLGASEGIVVRLISKDFLILVAISLVFAIVGAYYFIDTWLQDFVYRTNISVIVFILSAIATLLITLLTVSFHAYKASITNPAESIRIE